MGKRKKTTLVSALPPLTPVSILDLNSGELLEQSNLDESLTQLIEYVRVESQRLWLEHKNTLASKMESITASNPAEVGRQVGLSINTSELPRSVKAKSRIERLTRYNVITSAKSYYNSPVLTKREPSFNPLVNLGAVDAQMASVTMLDNGIIELRFKCWLTDYLLTFKLPSYVRERNISKITLPVIKPWGESYGFIFNLEELPSTPIVSDKYAIGIDLGRVEPYTLAVIHVSSGSRVAQYSATPRLRVLTAKRDRLNQELSHLLTKSNAYASLGLNRELLERERYRTRVKRNRLMEKISWVMAKEVDEIATQYQVPVINMEDLSWVNPKHGMSRWTHSQDQAAITHKLARSGRVTRKVNARNTSQDCSKCNGRVIHKSGRRLVVCSDCRLVLDRDLNAAINIANRPPLKRSMGSNYSSTEQITLSITQSNKRPLTSLTITRKTS